MDWADLFVYSKDWGKPLVTHRVRRLRLGSKSAASVQGFPARRFDVRPRPDPSRAACCALPACADCQAWVGPRAAPVLQVRIQRDHEFWAALMPHLWDFWWRHCVPARQALEEHQLLQAETLAAGPLSPAGLGLASGQSEGLEVSLKAAVRDYLPSKLLPGSATKELEQWAQSMYSRAETLV